MMKFSSGDILFHELHDAHKTVILLHTVYKMSDINKKQVLVTKPVSSWVSMQCNLKKRLKSAR